MKKLLYYIIYIFVILFTEKSFSLDFTVDNGDSRIIDNNIGSLRRGFYDWQYFIKYPLISNYCEIYSNSTFGNLIHIRTDINVEDISFPILVRFYYNSASDNYGFTGLSWKCNLSIRYITNNHNKSIIIIMPDDKNLLFKYDKLTNKYLPQYGCIDSLEVIADKGFKLKIYNDNYLNNGDYSEYLFESNLHHYVTRIIDRNKNTIFFDYSNNKNLSKVTYPSGRILNFFYLNDKISSINFDGLKNISYHYNQEGDFDKVILNNNYEVNYYSDINCKKLTRIIENNVNLIDLGYNEENKVNEIRYNDSTVKFSLNYNEKSRTTELYKNDIFFSGFKYDSLYRYIEFFDFNNNSEYYTWNLDYQLTKSIDKNSNPTSFFYGNSGKIHNIVFPENIIRNFNFDTQHKKILSFNDEEINTYEYKYDNFGNLEQILLNSNSFISQQNDENGLPVGFIDPTKRNWTIKYDKYGNINKIIFPNTANYIFESDRYSNITQFLDANNHNYQFIYNYFNFIQLISNPDNTSKKFIFNDNGFLTSILNPDNSSLAINYDKMGRITQYTGLLNEKYQFKYEINDNISVTLPNNQNVTIEYLSNNKLNSITNANNSTYSILYDKVFNIKSIKNFNNSIFTYEYDKANRITAITDLNNRTLRYTYYPSGKIKQIINPNNEITTFNYFNDKMREISKSLGFKFVFDYDSDGNISSFTDANNNKYQYLYFYDGKLSTVIKPNQSTIKFEYDSNGNLIYKYNENNDRIEYKFTARNAIKEIINEKGYSKIFNLNFANRITQYSDELENIYKFEYDKAGKIINIIYPNGYFKKFEYDFQNNLNSFSINNVTNISFNYNLIGNLIEIKSSEHSPYNYSYNSNNELTAIDNNFDEIKILYDKINRPINIIDSYNKMFTINYNNNSLINKITLPTGSNYEINYNGLNYPVNIRYPENYIWSYFYDLNGNIIRNSIDEITLWSFNYNNMNLLIKVATNTNDTLEYDYLTNGKISKFRDLYSNYFYFAYDKSSNLELINMMNEKIKYNYNALNQIIQIVYDSINSLSIDYYNNRKIKKINYGDMEFSFQYNSLNFTNKIKLNNADLFNFTFTNDGLINSIADRYNSITKFKYNQFGNITSKISKDNLEYIYEYDLLGRLNNTYDTHGRQTKMDYNENGMLSTLTNRELIQTNYFYDKANRLKVIKFNRTDSIELSHNYFNQIASLKTRNNQLYRFEYDLLNRLTSIISPTNNTLKFKYSANNANIQIISPLNDTSLYNYDNKLRLQSILKADSINYKYVFNKYGLVMNESINNHIINANIYDNSFKLIAQLKDKINYTYHYNDLLNIAKFEIINDTFNIQYDANFFSEISNKKNIFKFQYNKIGNLLNYQNNNKKYSFIYDNDFGLKSLIAPLNYKFEVFFDDEGRIDSLRNPIQNLTYFQYDGLNNVRKIQFSNNFENTNSYDQNSNLILYNDESLNKIDLKYDSNDMLASKTASKGSITNYKYDKNGNTFEINHSDNMFSLMYPKYDAINRYIGLDMYFMSSIKREIRFDLDYMNRLSIIKFNDLEKITYKYNNDGKINSIIDYDNDSIIYNYNSIDRKKIVRFPNGINASYSYNLQNQVSEYKLIDANNSEIIKRYYSYDEYGNIIQIKFGNDSIYSLIYDELDQLIFIYTNFNDTISYNYDAHGNIINQKYNDILTIYNYNSNEKLTSFGSVEYTYDNNGNVTSKADSNGTIQFYYDSENRLARAIKNDNEILNFHYSGKNQLIRISGAIEEFYFPFQIENEPNSNILMEYDNNQILKKRYLYSPNDSSNFENIGYIDIRTNKKYYIHREPTNTNAFISDETGNVLKYFETDIFGNVTQTIQSDAKFRFNGMAWIDLLKMYFHNGRFYDPACGRYIQKNKHNNSLLTNNYNFNNNNPLNEIKLNNKKEKLKINQDLLIKDISPFNNIFLNTNPAFILSDLYSSLINQQFNNFVNFNVNTNINYNNLSNLIDSNYSNPSNFIDYFLNNEIEQFTNFDFVKFYPKLNSEIFEPFLFESINQPIIQELSIPILPKNNKIQKVINLISMTELPKEQHYKKQLEFIVRRIKSVEFKHNNIFEIKLNNVNFNDLNLIFDSKYNFINIYKNNFKSHKSEQFSELEALNSIKNLENGFDSSEQSVNNYIFDRNLFPLIKNTQPSISLMQLIPEINEFAVIKEANSKNIHNMIKFLQNINPAKWNFGKYLYDKQLLELPYSLEYENNNLILPLKKNYSKIPSKLLTK